MPVYITRNVFYLAYIMLNGLLASTCFLNYIIYCHNFNITIYGQVQNLQLIMMSPSDMIIMHPNACKNPTQKLQNCFKKINKILPHTSTQELS